MELKLEEEQQQPLEGQRSRKKQTRFPQKGMDAE